MASSPRRSRLLRWALWILAGVVGAFFVARGVIEIASIDVAHPETYRNDWADCTSSAFSRCIAARERWSSLPWAPGS